MKYIIEESSIDSIVVAPLVIAAIQVVTSILLGNRIFPDGIPQWFSSITISLACFITGLSGLAQVVRREAPGPLGKNKKWAVINGYGGMIIFWGSGLVLLCLALIN